MDRAERRVMANSIRGGTQSKWNSYYSRVRFESTLAALTYSIASGLESKAFSYGVGSGMTSAGFITIADVATYADTNLQTQNQTVAGENVIVKGVGIMLQPHSDFQLAKRADFSISVRAVINATMVYPLGIPSMIPGPGGLTGFGDSATVGAPQLGQLEKVGVVTNGMPIATNYFAFPDPLIWRSAGNGDSAFNVILKTERKIATDINLGLAARAGVAAGAGTSGAAIYTPATATAAGPQFGTVLDYMVVLIGRTLNPLSDN